MAKPRRKKAAPAKAAPKRAAARKKTSTGGPPVWLIFSGLAAAGAMIYFVSQNYKSSTKPSEPLQEKVNQMAAENPDAEIFQIKDEPVQTAGEKKK